MLRVAIVTSAAAAGLDEDLPALLDALREEGATAEAVAWDDAAVRWGAFDIAVVRSTWDYSLRREEFLRWAARAEAATRLVHPEPVLRWNTDKRYLVGLAAAGIAVVPTRWVEPTDAVAETPFEGDVVVKPMVSAGARDTARYAARDAGAWAHVRRLQADGRGVMLQPYLRRIDEAGETALVYLAGEYSHAFRKGPILLGATRMVDGLYAEEQLGPREPSAAEHELAERVMDATPFPRAQLLYARVDLAPGDDGHPWLLEFEATEPSLYFKFGAGSARRLARAIVARA